MSASGGMFDHPHTKQYAAEITDLLTSVKSHLLHSALAPTVAAEHPQAAAALLQAFGVKDAKKRNVSGFALKMDGTFPLDSQQRIVDTLGLWNAGLGTSMYAVERVPAHFERGGSDEAVKHATIKAGGRLPKLISPSHVISLARAGDDFGNDNYAIMVTANDVPAARVLHEYALARANAKEPLTLHTLASSAEYRALQASSQCVRDTLAQKFASAHGIVLRTSDCAPRERSLQPTPQQLRKEAETAVAEQEQGQNELQVEEEEEGQLRRDSRVKPLLTTLHYTIERTTNAAHGKHENPATRQSAAHPEVYVVHNNVSPSGNAAGGVLVSHGLLGGFTHFTHPQGKTWQNPTFLSTMPASSGKAHGTHTRAHALHRKSDARAEQAFQARVAWHSDVGERFLHSAANEQYYALHDPYVVHWVNELTTGGGVNDKPLSQRQYKFVAAQLPNMSTLYASREELANIARQDATSTNLPVALDNPIVRTIPEKWDTVVRPSGFQADIDQVFANKYDDDDSSGFQVLSTASACNDPSHDHARAEKLYTDAARLGIAKSAAAPAKRTILMLQKDLIKILTND